MTSNKETPLLRVTELSHYYGDQVGCEEVNLEVYNGEVLGIVGESGSGKTTLLKIISGLLPPTQGTIEFDKRIEGSSDIYQMSEPERRLLMRTDWGIIYQNPKDGLRMNVSAGANVGERLMAVGARNYSYIRAESNDWLNKVEMDLGRIDHFPDRKSVV